jgi:hypothetical protein
LIQAIIVITSVAATFVVSVALIHRKKIRTQRKLVIFQIAITLSTISLVTVFAPLKMTQFTAFAFCIKTLMIESHLAAFISIANLHATIWAGFTILALILGPAMTFDGSSLSKFLDLSLSIVLPLISFGLFNLIGMIRSAFNTDDNS